MSRLIRLLNVIALFAGLLLACAAVTLAILVFSAIAFSGSTGQAHAAFWQRIEPLFVFSIGAVAAGGIASVANALVTSRGIWFWPIMLFSALGGTATVLSPPLAASLAHLAMPVIGIVGKILLADQGLNEAQEYRLTQFVRANQALVADIGPVRKVWVVSHIKSRSGAPDRYEVAVSGDRELYAIIEDNDRQGKEAFRLRCTTTVSMGKRDSRRDPCEQ